MELLAQVVSEFDVDENLASKALGAVFTSVRMAMDTKTFAAVATAFPDVGTWMRDAPVTGGRTGEMLALATPRTLRRNLSQLGLAEPQIDRLGALAGKALRESIPAEVFERITVRLPMFAA